jgi:RNA polymerase primary sigma factor
VKSCSRNTIDEIAYDLMVEKDKVCSAIQTGKNHISLDSPVNIRDERNNLIDLLESREDMPDKTMCDNSLKEGIERTLDALTEREKEIVKLYFGIGEETNYTLEEIGKRFKLTRERVRQIKEKALRRLKHTKNKKKLLDFY